ncbi:hypothetical protein FQN49_006576 [Arthroderma sp. PD_2]|nr:hypothetical protein FQN49_006576 [Arthroderma sp. PD_2]
MTSKEGRSMDEPNILIDESKYRGYVLQLAGDTLEEEELEILRQNALDLGLSIEDNREGPKGQEVATAESTASKSTSTTTTSASQLNIPSSISSLSPRGSSSAHSVTSFATFPATYNNADASHRLSVFDAFPSRHSFDASYCQDQRLKSGFRQSIFSRFPYFRKRSSVPTTPPPRYQCTPNASQVFQKDYSPEVRADVTPSSQVSPPTHQEMADVGEPIDMESVARSLTCSILTTLREMHQGQKQRHLAFKKELLGSIKAKHDALIEERRKQNVEREAALETQNTTKSARLEEIDLVAEISLVAELQREKQILQTSIRHMEAYFNTPPPSLSSNKDDLYTNLQPRELTDQKRSRLYQSYHELNTLDALHESKIKVLRDKQARNFQETLRTMELDAKNLARLNESALRALEKCRQDETTAAIAWLDGREQKLIYKWALEEGISRKQLEVETKQTYGPLPTISFDESDNDTTPCLL